MYCLALVIKVTKTIVLSPDLGELNLPIPDKT